MSKDRLLSDGELLKIIRQHPEHMNATEKGYGGYTSEDLLELFNAQKRLYAESVIGEDKSMGGQFHTWYCSSDRNSEQNGCICPDTVRKKLRAEQRARIK